MKSEKKITSLLSALVEVFCLNFSIDSEVLDQAVHHRVCQWEGFSLREKFHNSRAIDWSEDNWSWSQGMCDMIEPSVYAWETIFKTVRMFKAKSLHLIPVSFITYYYAIYYPSFIPVVHYSPIYHHVK